MVWTKTTSRKIHCTQINDSSLFPLFARMSFSLILFSLHASQIRCSLSISNFSDPVFCAPQFTFCFQIFLSLMLYTINNPPLNIMSNRIRGIFTQQTNTKWLYGKNQKKPLNTSWSIWKSASSRVCAWLLNKPCFAFPE